MSAPRIRVPMASYTISHVLVLSNWRPASCRDGRGSSRRVLDGAAGEVSYHQTRECFLCGALHHQLQWGPRN